MGQKYGFSLLRLLDSEIEKLYPVLWVSPGVNIWINGVWAGAKDCITVAQLFSGDVILLSKEGSRDLEYVCHFFRGRGAQRRRTPVKFQTLDE